MLTTLGLRITATVVEEDDVAVATYSTLDNYYATSEACMYLYNAQ